MWALVVFTLASGTLTGLLSLLLARWSPNCGPVWQQMRAVSRQVAQITARDLLGGGTLPLAQLAISAVFGLTAAGAFQIAARILGLLDALTLAPLRYITLPRYACSQNFGHDLCVGLRHSAILGVWVWCGVAVACQMC